MYYARWSKFSERKILGKQKGGVNHTKLFIIYSIPITYDYYQINILKVRIEKKILMLIDK